MDRLVSVDTKELHLHLKTSTSTTSAAAAHRCSATFVVTSLMHTMSVAIHLTTTRPTSFSISPTQITILPPLSSASFSLLFSSPSSLPLPLVSPPDSLLVRSVLLPTGKADTAALLRLFSKPGVHVFKDANVPLSFVGVDAAFSLLSSFSSLLNSLQAPLLLSKAAVASSPSDLSLLLLRAAASGRSGFVSVLLESGADVNSRDDSHRSALSFAVSSGSMETVKLLLSSDARVDPSVDRLMHEAAAGNRVDVMEALAGAHSSAWADTVDAQGRTPVHMAAMHGSLDAVQFCVKAGGGDPDRADGNGWTPIHFAASGGFLEIVEFLLECSFYSKYALTGDGRKTPFDLAVDSGHAHLFDVLRLGDAMNRAAWSDDVSMVRSCLSQGAEVDRRDQNGWTPLHRSAFKGRLEVVKVLVENGAKVDAMDDAGYSPLRLAMEAGHVDVALWLVAQGAARTGLEGVKGLDRLRLKLDSCAASAE